MNYGRSAEAEAIMARIDRDFRRQGYIFNDDELPHIRLAARRFTPLREVAETLFVTHRQRTAVGLALMAAQAFFYNAIFFTYALVLTDFYAVRVDHVGWYLLPFAAGNVLGPIVLGPFFDTIGRRPMIASTYAISGVLLAISGWLFANGMLSAVGPDALVDGNLFLRLNCCQLRLPHSQRDLPDRGSGACYCVLLRYRHRHWRRRRPLAAWHADRYRLP